MKYLDELGKGLINFANIGTILLFFKSYFDSFNYLYVVSGTVFFISFYVMALKIIHISEEMSDE